MKRHYLAMLSNARKGGDGRPLEAGASTQSTSTAEIELGDAGLSGKLVVGAVDATREKRPRLARGAPAPPGAGAALSPAGGMHTLVLIGELDRVSAHTLEAKIEQLCESGTGGITLDLSRLTYIDATGVAVIAFRSRLCQRRGYEFALIPGSWLIQRAFELAGLVDHLPFASP
jgi:anti-anti-sigma factor